jgi:hypothetical protein
MLCELISETAIRTLRLSGNPLGDDTVCFLAGRLRRNSVLCKVPMTIQDFISLCNALKENTTLETISLSDNRLEMRAFAELFGPNGALLEVGMKNYLVDDDGCDIASNASLTDLDISGNRIDIRNTQCLLDALLRNYSLGRFLYAENPIPDSADQFWTFLNCYTHNLLMPDMTAASRERLHIFQMHLAFATSIIVCQ